MFHSSFIFSLVPLASTVLITVSVYTRSWVNVSDEPNGLTSEIFMGSNLPSIAITAQVMNLIGSILIYVSYLIPTKKNCLRPFLFFICNIASCILVLLIITKIGSGSGRMKQFHPIPFCRDFDNPCEGDEITIDLFWISTHFMLLSFGVGPTFIYAFARRNSSNLPL